MIVGMKRSLILTAALSSLLTLLAFWTMGMQTQQTQTQQKQTQQKNVKLENDRVKVTEVVYQPGVPRERYVRPTDQVIVFLDDSRYERTDSQTKEKTVRQRKSGDVIWHDKGEDAPVLINLGKTPYRTLVIELKK
jgi:hypothetical protein